MLLPTSQLGRIRGGELQRRSRRYWQSTGPIDTMLAIALWQHIFQPVNELKNGLMAKLYFYYSAMNAGKSTTLLQAAHNYEERGMRVLLFTPRVDDRDGIGTISSRISLRREAFAFEKELDLYVHIRNEHEQSSVACVFIDEAQFLTAKQVLQLTLVCDRIGIPVLCYGLRTDFRGEPFEGSKYLLAWSDVLGEIKTICHSGKKATMNARLDESGNRVSEGEQVAIGLNYVALSRSEFGLDKVSPVGYQPPE